MLVGISREAAYRLRRRDSLFARGWNGAIELARDSSADVLTCRAIDGVVEDVWYRGELVGTRIRHDTRLLLAHLARLDRLAEQNTAGADAERFDELLALIAGATVPEEIAASDDPLPLDRESCISGAMQRAGTECRAEAEAELDEAEDYNSQGYLVDDELAVEIEDRSIIAGDAAALAASAQWDEWFQSACGTVDEVMAGAEFSPRTVSTVSTSGLDQQEKRHPEPVSGSIYRPAQFDHFGEMDPETSSG